MELLAATARSSFFAMSNSLLTRIERAADPTNVERHTWRAEDLAGAVVRHLRQMLSTRQGSSLTCPDYGIPDVTHYMHDIIEAQAIMQRAIKHTVQNYEPRLKNPQVRLIRSEIPGQLGMLFELSGHIILADGRRRAVRIGANVNELGRTDLTEL